MNRLEQILEAMISNETVQFNGNVWNIESINKKGLISLTRLEDDSTVTTTVKAWDLTLNND